VKNFWPNLKLEFSKWQWKFTRSQDERVKFDVFSVCRGHHLITYRGIKAIRCPFDYVIYQQLICELKPDLVIEIGTNIGGGALYLADLMNIIEHGMVHTIDIKKQYADIIAGHPRIRTFSKGWQEYDLSEAKNASSVLVIEDSSHTYENTAAVLEKFAPVVTPGSYLIVEDGIVNELGMKAKYNGGPLRAIREFLNTHREFEIDRHWCDLFGHNATFNVNGYLRRRA
jgi:cephalosporin hydroxylase